MEFLLTKNMIIILLIIGVSIYAALYIPIKLYQINKNTKAIKEYLKLINENISNLNSKKEKDYEIKDYGIEIVENIDFNK